MTNTGTRSVWLSKAGKWDKVWLYVFSVLLTLTILHVVAGAFSINFRLPLSYDGDTQMGYMLKGMVDGEWYPGFGIHSDRLAAPFGFTLGDYPITENLFLWIIKLVSLYTRDYIYAINIYFVLTFVLTTVSFVYVLRYYRLSLPTSIVFAQLFTFLPYHFMRGIQHLFLASYFLVPLLVLIITWIWAAKPIFFRRNADGYSFDCMNYKSLFSVLVLLCAGAGGVYYAFFFAFFAVIAGVSAFFYRHNRYHFYSSALLVVIICGSLGLNILPNILYKITHGKNVIAAHRSPMEAELYGLKIAQLLLPVDGHRIIAAAELKNNYNAETGANENTTATLGAIGSLGFIILLANLIFFRLRSRGILSRLTPLLFGGVLFATVGGFSSLFAIFISSQIRAYNRISIFLACFSLMAMAFIFNNFLRSYKNKTSVVFLTGILILGIFDQTTSGMKFSQPFTEEYISDRNFTQAIERAVPKGAMIWQMPYMSFPETPPIYHMSDYSPFKGYLHSTSLRWSYGAMRGRPADFWMKMVSSLPIEQMVEQVSLAGFEGIYIDRYGYKNSVKEIETPLKNLLKVEPLTSKNERFVFFSMAKYNAGLKNTFSEDEREKRKLQIPLEISWSGSFSDLEGSSENNWRWCGKDGQLTIYNASEKDRVALVKTYIATGHAEMAKCVVKSKFFSDEVQVNSHGVYYEKRIQVPGNSNTIISFSSDAARVAAPGDPRYLVFRLINFKLEELHEH